MSRNGLYRAEYEHDACGIGAIAHLHGVRSHQTLDDALSVLVNLEHRGGKGLEKNTGDGAGVLFQLPHRFFRKEAQKEGQLLPDEGDYGVAMLFLPHDDPAGVTAARQVFERGCAECGVPLMFWREVPVDPHDLGSTARACMPTIYQAFLRRPEDVARGLDFERRLYVCRRTIERAADATPALDGKIFYVCSMSSRTIVYKGMLVATQMRRFYLDLNDAAVGDGARPRALALLHQHHALLGARAPQPLHHPQRRDQHPARQRELDPRARAEPLLAGAGRGPGARAADHQPRGLGLRDPGQRA